MKTSIPNGLLIVIDGIAGAGKTTQANLLSNYFRARGLRCEITEEGSDGAAPTNLEAGAKTQGIVILERSYASIIAGRGSLNRRPDIRIVLDVPVSVAVQRTYHNSAGSNDVTNDISVGTTGSLRKAREFYHRMANADDDLLLVDSFGTATEISECLLTAVIRCAVEKIAQFRSMTAESVNDVIEIIQEEEAIRGLWPELDAVLGIQTQSLRPRSRKFPTPSSVPATEYSPLSVVRALTNLN